jgi:2-polyprenyl-6-methoxyphenol hydroxylase-like FAD-dependent oxidoreductase
MSPARGSGANTALRDAALLATELGAAARDDKTVVQAIADYEGSPYHPAKKQRLGSRPGNGPVCCGLVMAGGGYEAPHPGPRGQVQSSSE